MCWPASEARRGAEIYPSGISPAGDPARRNFRKRSPRSSDHRGVKVNTASTDQRWSCSTPAPLPNYRRRNWRAGYDGVRLRRCFTHARRRRPARRFRNRQTPAAAAYSEELLAHNQYAGASRRRVAPSRSAAKYQQHIEISPLASLPFKSHQRAKRGGGRDRTIWRWMCR